MYLEPFNLHPSTSVVPLFNTLIYKENCKLYIVILAEEGPRAETFFFIKNILLCYYKFKENQ